MRAGGPSRAPPIADRRAPAPGIPRSASERQDRNQGALGPKSFARISVKCRLLKWGASIASEGRQVHGPAEACDSLSRDNLNPAEPDGGCRVEPVAKDHQRS